MKIEAKTIEEFIEKCGDRKDDIIFLDNYIMSILPNIKRYLYSSKSITMLSYGEVPYKTTTYEGLFPLIGLTPQKNNISLYITIWKDGKTLPELYGKKLGKVSVGKSCVRFKKVENLDLDILKVALLEAHEWCKEQKNG
ncbi:DUF1801 domain-containing protein [Marinitoga litoralis]|uniref:DUF1801 domain-containing protein n=1 Tax=Marinitoga litoralis TaxID=570855 RepID=UPI0019616549|nr:DUF1801 domain-containing protein [Marinitoga litoralis]MBM7560392.1 hypothetical protein [Marinitoga litoralis]